MRDNKFSFLSLLLSTICFVMILWVNYKIAERYLLVDGKTKALFGVIEIGTFFYQYYFIFLSLFALMFAFIGSKKKEGRPINLIAYVISLFSIVFIFMRVWTFMI